MHDLQNKKAWDLSHHDMQNMNETWRKTFGIKKTSHTRNETAPGLAVPSSNNLNEQFVNF